MRKYCKAYKLGNFRQFQGWQEREQRAGDPLTDDTICYLWDDFTVVRSPIQQDTVLFTSDSPEWKTFCTQTLAFSLPEDLAAPKSQLSGTATA